MVIAIPVAPLDPETTQWLARLLLIGVIGLIGWTGITALNIAADLYLRQFRLDVDDNLLARKHVTQVRVLLRAGDVLVVLVTFGAALMTFEPVRQYGVSLFASAGVAGIVAGLAARPVLSNLFAGVQLAMTQPIRIDDAVIVENEFGTIEEITSTYVVVRLWDWRRMIVPLSYFIEKPFQNWTRGEARHDAGNAGGGEQADAILPHRLERHQRGANRDNHHQHVCGAQQHAHLREVLARQQVVVDVEPELPQVKIGGDS